MAINVKDEIDPMEEFVPREIHPKPFRPEDIDPARIVVSFDRRSDTLLIHLFGRGIETISVPIGKYLYVMVTPDTETIVGFHVEGFLAQATKDVPEAIDLLDYAELRGITAAEVRALRNEAREAKPPFNGRMPATWLPDERKRAVASFIDAERTRIDLSFVPSIP
jgi:hypothetical protein